ncbi:MAG: cytochrome c maturation protein CcmE [Bacteroidota bacterium]|nr:cytochrome c maturation protein CcmE [Bacteroidota bacterium]
MKRAHIIALVLIAAAIVTITSAIGSTSEYVSFTKAALNPGKEFHIVGTWVKEAGLHYDPLKDPNYFSFKLRDEAGTIHTVILQDSKPQDFEHSEKIVVVGSMTDTYFDASSILMKCPSKYENEEVKVKAKS